MPDHQQPGAGEPRIALLALPQSTPAALHGLHEVFDAVGHAWQELTGEPPAGPRMRARIVTRDGRPLASPNGLPIQPHGALGDADAIVVTDLALAPGFEPAGSWEAEIGWLRARHAAGATVCSVCTGSVVLAEAGLLDGEVATTHWSAVDLMRRRYPSVRLEPQRILTAAGEGGRILTAGGASAWEELALCLIARFSGATEAVRAAKIFLLGDRSEGQLPFAGARPARRHDDAAVAAAQAWIAANYHRENPVALMAGQAGLTARTFARRFRAATGYAPMDYVQTLRIEEAKQLLETTATPVETIAAEVGYEDPAFFRRLFRRQAGVTPARYRQRFARIAGLAPRPAG